MVFALGEVDLGKEGLDGLTLTPVETVVQILVPFEVVVSPPRLV